MGGNLGSSEEEDERFLPPIPRVSVADRANGPNLCASEHFLDNYFSLPQSLGVDFVFLLIDEQLRPQSRRQHTRSHSSLLPSS
jgi:hypothetical protein